MWTYNNMSELYHYGVPGMKWGVRKARMAERVAIRRAAGAITDKRKEAFLKKANEYNQKAKTLEAIDSNNKTNKVDKGKKATKGILLGIGGVTIGVAAAAAIGFRKTLKDMNINPKEFMETAQGIYAASKNK